MTWYYKIDAGRVYLFNRPYEDDATIVRVVPYQLFDRRGFSPVRGVSRKIRSPQFGGRFADRKFSVSYQ